MGGGAVVRVAGGASLWAVRPRESAGFFLPAGFGEGGCGEFGGDYRVGGGGVVAFAGEHAYQAAGGLVSGQAGGEGAGFAGYQVYGSGALVVGGDGGEGLFDEVGGYAFAAEFLGEDLFALAGVGVAGVDPLLGEGGVVYQADLGEAVEGAVRHLDGETLGGQAIRQLEAAAGTVGE